MAGILSNLAEEARLAALNVADYATDLVDPTLRLGVTGLSRAGKTVFITTLVHNLTTGGRLPVFSAFADGRIARAQLRPQPDDTVPRFDFETHRNALLGANRDWPESTRAIGELRVTLEFESNSLLARTFRGGRLNLDLVDYPGEWLLDLPLLDQDYAPSPSRRCSAPATQNARRMPSPFSMPYAAPMPHGPLDEPSRPGSPSFTPSICAPVRRARRRFPCCRPVVS
jgi:predicted YcjX-like family ATPase